MGAGRGAARRRGRRLLALHPGLHRRLRLPARRPPPLARPGPVPPPRPREKRQLPPRQGRPPARTVEARHPRGVRVAQAARGLRPQAVLGRGRRRPARAPEGCRPAAHPGRPGGPERQDLPLPPPGRPQVGGPRHRRAGDGHPRRPGAERPPPVPVAARRRQEGLRALRRFSRGAPEGPAGGRRRQEARGPRLLRPAPLAPGARGREDAGGRRQPGARGDPRDPGDRRRRAERRHLPDGAPPQRAPLPRRGGGATRPGATR